MAAVLMKKKGVSAVVVGADRVVANGDTANKVRSVNDYWHTATAWYNRIKQQRPRLVLRWVSMSISVDSSSDETSNQGLLALLLRRQYELPFGIDIVQFLFFFFNKE